MSASFPEGRWRRAGALAREVLDLSAEWQELAEDAKALYEQEVAGVSDSELRARLQQWRDGATTSYPENNTDPAAQSGPSSSPEGGGEPAAPSDQPPTLDTARDHAATAADDALAAIAEAEAAQQPVTQPAANPTATTVDQGEQVAQGTGEPMVESTTGELTGDGTGTALPPIPDDGTGTPLPPADPATDPEAPSPAPGSEADDADSVDPPPFVPTDEDLQGALTTAASAAAYISAYPDPAIRERLLVLESEGKARKSVLDILANNDE